MNYEYIPPGFTRRQWKQHQEAMTKVAMASREQLEKPNTLLAWINRRLGR